MKTLRPLYLAAFLLLNLPLLAPSCNKNSDPAPQNTHPSTVASVWAWQKLLVSPPVGNIDDILDFYVQLNVATNKCLPIFLYDFKTDGSVVPIEQTICQSSGISALQFGPKTGDKWSVSGSKLTMTHADGSQDVVDLELTDGTLSSGARTKVMTWKRNVNDQLYTWRFERKL